MTTHLGDGAHYVCESSILHRRLVPVRFTLPRLEALSPTPRRTGNATSPYTFASSSTRYSTAWGNHRLTGQTGLLRLILARDRTHRSRVSLSTYLGTDRTASRLRLDPRRRSRKPNRCAKVSHHPETKLRCPKGMSSREDQGILRAPPLTVKSDLDRLD